MTTTTEEPRGALGSRPLPDRSEAIVERIHRSIEVDSNGCWVWMAGRFQNRYGRIHFDGRTYKVHRLMCHWFNGPVSVDLVVDHLCRNPPCVNPAHLEAVESVENIARGDNPTKRAARQTHCKRGHEYTPENTMYQPAKNGTRSRYCRECHNARVRRRWRDEHMA